MDQKDVGNVTSLANIVADIFETDKENTWGESLKLIEEILRDYEIDKSLIDPIGAISDEEIRQYLVDDGTAEEEISQEDIDGTRYFIKMSIAWIYTLINDKTE